VNVTDPIADILTRIRNACKAKHKKVDIPSSKLKKQIAQVLLDNKYIANFVEVEDERQNLLRIILKYDRENRSVITGLKRVSKPGLRIYFKKEDLKLLERQLGMTLLSTSKGILTDRQARNQRIGGEAICKVW
jgi:small subunit ribosomal protein S8